MDNDKTKIYLCDYWYKGQQWSVEISAESWEEAQQRMRCVGQGKIVGELQVTLPCALGWAAKAWVALRGWLGA